MVKVTLNFEIPLESLRELLTFLPPHAVNDATLAAEPCVQELGDVGVNIFDLFFISDLVDQICSVEAALKAHHVL